MTWWFFCLVQVQRRNNWVLDASSVIFSDLHGLLNNSNSCRTSLSVYFVTCPKQGLEMEAVVLHWVAFLEYFCPKQGQDFKPLEGYRMVLFNLKVLAKFGLCSNCSQKLDECSLARARKIFATARMLEFSLEFPYGKTEKHCGKMQPLWMFLETCILEWSYSI